MFFSEQIRLHADPIFDAIRIHPFVQDIAQERLSREAIVHYVKQDIQYLNTYAQVYGFALSKSQTRAQMQLFHDRIAFVLNGEVTPHQNLCRVAEVRYEELQRPVPMSPTTHHYARHMLATAHSGSLGEILTAILPCHWTYVDLARHLAAETNIVVHPDHLFYEWITYYASDGMLSGLRELTALLDQCAELCSESERASMESIFLDGCRLEHRFFTMAYTQEVW